MRYQEILEACWSGYRQQGMKKKGDRMVPNCVPVAEVKTGPEMTLNDLLYTAAAKAMRDASREGIDLDYEDAIQQASKIYGIPYTPSQLPKLQAQLKALDARIAPLKQQLDLKKQQRKQQKYGMAPAVAQPQGSVTPATGRIKPATKTLEEEYGDPFIDNAARELLAMVLMFGVPFVVGVYMDIRNKIRKYQGREIIDALERKGVTMNRQTYDKVKPVLDRFDQAIRDDDGAEAKALAKQIQQMIVMGKLSAPEPRPADTALAAKEKELSEDLKKWFKEKWVRFGPDGKIRGDCARGSSKEGKPKCLPQSKAHALGKKGRASAAARKRREDPNPERRGPARNVATKVREQGVAEGYSNTTFNVDRRKLNVPALIQKGAIFVTYPHGEQGWETDNKEDWAFSLLSLYNVLQGGWPSEAKKYLKPESYRRAEQQINSSAPNLGSDKLVYDGKYNQILWSIKKLGIPDNVAFLDKGQQGVAEGHADQQRKIFKKNGRPVGEVGIDRESSPGVGQWYMKCYAYDIDNSGYDSYEEAVAELKYCLKQGVAEGKIKLSTDPNWYGAEVGDYKASGPIVNIPADRLVGFEPDDKMNQSASKTNVEKIVAGLKQGAKLPPLLVRQYENGYQVLDGHHRFWAYKLLGVKSIPAQVVPAKDIEKITKQGVAEMDKSQTPPARHGDYPLGAKGTTAKPVPAKKVVKDLARDLDKAFAKEKGVAEVKKPAPRTRGEFVPAANSSDSYKAGYDLGVKLVRAANMTQAAKTQVVQTQSQQQAMPADFIKGYKKGFSDVAGYIRNQQDANRIRQFAKFKSITPDQVQQIVTRYSAGETSPQIAPDFGLDAQQILRLIDKQANRDEIIRLNRQNRKGKIGPQRQLAFDEAQTDYQKRRQRERDVDAGRPVKPLPKNPRTDYQKRREQQRREQDLGEEAITEGFEYGSRVQHPKYGAGQVMKVYSNGVITVNFPNYPDPIDKNPGVQSNFAPGDKDYQSLKPMVSEKQDACYRKVKSRYKVWPSAYASGALVQCRKKGAANWGNKKK